MTEQSEPARPAGGPQDHGGANEPETVAHGARSAQAAAPEPAAGPADPAGDGFEIPVADGAAAGPGPDPAGGPRPPGAAPGGERAPARPGPGESGDWTRGDSVRDDPGTLGEEVRKLWEVVHDHFVDPVLRNYPEAAGHLGSAGLEVASAFRALLRAGEQRWTGKPPAERDGGAGPDWDGRIVIGEDGGDTDEDTAVRPKD